MFPYIKKTYKNWKSQNDAARCKSEFTFFLTSLLNTERIIYLYNMNTDIVCVCFALVVCLETDHLSKYSANTELARQKLQESYNQSSILAKLKEEEVFHDFIIKY